MSSVPETFAKNNQRRRIGNRREEAKKKEDNAGMRYQEALEEGSDKSNALYNAYDDAIVEMSNAEEAYLKFFRPNSPHRFRI